MQSNVVGIELLEKPRTLVTVLFVVLYDIVAVIVDNSIVQKA